MGGPYPYGVNPWWAGGTDPNTPGSPTATVSPLPPPPRRQRYSLEAATVGSLLIATFGPVQNLTRTIYRVVVQASESASTMRMYIGDVVAQNIIDGTDCATFAVAEYPNGMPVEAGMALSFVWTPTSGTATCMVDYIET